MMHWSKRLFLINRDFQLRYTRAAVLVALCTTLLTVFLLLFPLFHLHILRFPNFVPSPFIAAMVFAAVVNFIIISTLGILLTHRIAGPVFAMVRHMRMFTEGYVGPALRIRNSDDLKYLIRNYNDFICHLQAERNSDLSRVQEAIQSLSSAEPGARGSANALELLRKYESDLKARMRREVAAGDSGGVKND